MSISVIVATYGDRDWFDLGEKRAVPSAFYQGAENIVSVYAEEATVSMSRNAGIEQADGDWLIFLDADDELAPGYVAAMETAIERAEDWTCKGCNGMRSALCGDCEAAARDRSERTLFTPAVQTVRPGRTPGPPSFFREVPLRQANWLVVGTAIHRDLFLEVDGFHEAEHGLEDWGLWSKCARVGATVVKVPDAVYRYHVSPNSMHRQLWRDKNKQREAHRRVARELDEWEAARA